MPPPPSCEAADASIAGMAFGVRITGLAGGATCLGLCALLLGAMPVSGQQRPQQVTSDTPQYCLHLFDRVSELVRVAETPPPQEVTSLSSEGQRMCDQGQTRGGILRLRRALLMLTQQGDIP